jgi:TetR/AcrR family transcriptional regulator, fatty acid biosynthesis regulator
VTARRRLDPAVRRGLILDETARIVLADGLSALSMEEVARAAGVSKALVYSYFPSKGALLAALLLREHASFQTKARMAAEGVRTLDALIRLTTRAYLGHVAERGPLIQRLLGEPQAAAALRDADGAARKATVGFFAQAIAREHPITLERAATVADLLMGLTGAAGDHLLREGGDAREVEDMVVEMIGAALRRMGALERKEAA